MAVPLKQYAEIKDNYCIAYFGNNSKVIKDLSKAKLFIEKEFPGIRLFITTLDEFAKDGFIPKSSLQEYKGLFAYYREFPEDCHPVKIMLEESEIVFPEELFCF